MKLANLVKSKYFCYFTYALMVINLLGYVSTGSMECVVIFALATFACKSCLSTNMCLCIFGGLFVSNIIFGCSKVKEGFDLQVSDCANLSEAGCADATDDCEYKDEKCVAIAAATKDVEDAIEELDEEACKKKDGATWDDKADPEVCKEAFRNRRNRRKAVREAFSTIHRAVRSC
jgi:hypothetical protein